MEGYLSVKEFGAAGNGSTDDTAILKQAVNTVVAQNGASPAKLSGLYFSPGIYRIASNMEFPESMTLLFADFAMLSPDTEVTVTVLSRISAGLYAIFGGDGNIAGPLRVPEAYPQWFGASGSSASVSGSIQKNSNKLTLKNRLDFRNGQLLSIPGARPCQVSAPTGLTGAADGTTGASSYTYTVVAVDDTGGISSGASIHIANGPATLTPDNSITLRWNEVTGAAAYWVYGRTAGGAKRLAQVPGTTWTDFGAAVRSNAPSLPDNLPVPGALIARIVGGGGSTQLTLSKSSSYSISAFINHDDTFAVRRAFQSCGSTGKIGFPGGTYRISDTLICKVPQVSGNGKAELQFVPLASYDLKPCLDIVDTDCSIDHLSVSSGTEAYTLNNPYWADPGLFAGQYYEMFAHGSCGIRISGSSRPNFQKTDTKSTLKCGVLLDNRTGHISFHNCNIGGLIGVYCRLNTGDYLFDSCNVTGVFCGVMFGVRSVSNHSGGFGAQMNRVHMGFAPYSFYQTIDDAVLYRTSMNVEGLSCILSTVQHEQIGEAAFKLLSKSMSKLMVIGGFGLSWSINMYSKPRSGWQFALPDELMPPGERQQYAAWFGTLNYSDIPAGAATGNLFMSSAPGAKGTARIERLARTSDLDGLSPDYAVIVSKEPSVLVTFSPNKILERRNYRSNQPIGRGNLLRNPENPMSYRVSGGTLSTVPAAGRIFPAALQAELGASPILLQFTPAPSAVVCNLQLDFAPRPYLASALPLSLCLWIFTNSKNGVNARLLAKSASGTFTDYYSQTRYPRGSWIKLSGEEGTATNQQVQFHYLSLNIPADQLTLLCGVMVSEGPLSAYSPRPHLAADTDMELYRSGSALILTSPGGVRFRVTVDDQGQLTAIPATD